LLPGRRPGSTVTLLDNELPAWDPTATVAHVSDCDLRVDEAFSDADRAALYDLFHPPGRRGDFRFHLPRIMAAESVLDVGAGTGALLHLAREAGHTGRLVGLDPAAGMLAQARRRDDIEWVAGDLTSPELSGPFDLVVMTGHVFQVFLTDAQLNLVLRRVHRLLGEGGRVAFETRNPKAEGWRAWTPERYSDITGPDGTPVRFWSDVHTPVTGDTVTFSHVFTSPAWPEPLVSPSTLRFLGLDRIEAFLAAAGLSILECYGDFDGGPFLPDSPEIVIVAGIDCPARTSGP
jgi:SAM-dependent methyltransferase